MVQTIFENGPAKEPLEHVVADPDIVLFKFKRFEYELDPGLLLCEQTFRD
jgi:hypothetical protein